MSCHGLLCLQGAQGYGLQLWFTLGFHVPLDGDCKNSSNSPSHSTTSLYRKTMYTRRHDPRSYVTFPVVELKALRTDFSIVRIRTNLLIGYHYYKTKKAEPRTACLESPDDKAYIFDNSLLSLLAYKTVPLQDLSECKTVSIFSLLWCM
jgi:hypothetical protein